MKYLISLFLIPMSVFAQKVKAPPFEPFYSLRLEMAGGGGQMKYQNKKSLAIDSSSSKKIVNMNAKLVKLASPNFRWYVGASIEDYSFENINMISELAISGNVGMTYSLGNDLHLTSEFLIYQHMEFDSLGDIYRKLDPALKLEWRYDLITFDKNVLGVGQSYQSTLPISNMTNDSYFLNIHSDYDIFTQLYFRKVYVKNSLEFFLHHNFKVIENHYYRGELNNLLMGLRLAFPFQ